MTETGNSCLRVDSMRTGDGIEDIFFRHHFTPNQDTVLGMILYKYSEGGTQNEGLKKKNLKSPVTV